MWIDDFAADGQLAKAIPGFKPRASRSARWRWRSAKRLRPPGRWWWKRGPEPVKPTLTRRLRCGRKKGDYLHRLESAAGSALQPRSAHRRQSAQIHRETGAAQRALQLPVSRNVLSSRRWRAAICRCKTLSDVILLRSWSNQTPGWRYQHLRQRRGRLLEAWPLVTSTNDNCLGSDCPLYKDCFVVKARKKRWTPTWWWSTITCFWPIWWSKRAALPS